MNVGISDAEGVKPFWVNEMAREWGSFDKNFASRQGTPQAVEVNCQRFGSIIEKYGTPYYLKIDIEGKDYVCLEDLSGKELPSYVSLETGGLKALDKLNKLGYSYFKCISQFGFIPVEINRSPKQQQLERLQSWLVSRNIFLRILRKVGLRRWIIAQILSPQKYDGWNFPLGSSGPFGENTLGDWHTFEEMREIYSSLLAQKKQGVSSCYWMKGFDYSFWTDFHAKKAG